MRRCIICIFQEAVTFDIWEEIGSQNVRLYGEQLACFQGEDSLYHPLERCLKWSKFLLCQEAAAFSVFSPSPQAEELLRSTAARLSLTVHSLSEEGQLAFLTASFKNRNCEGPSICCYLNEQRPILLSMEDGAALKLFSSPEDFTDKNVPAENLLVTGYSAGQISLLATALLGRDALSISTLSQLAEMVSDPSQETAKLLDRLFHDSPSLSTDLMILQKLCQRFEIQRVALIPWNPSSCLPSLQKVPMP